ncbi:alpha/beta fold hydrolase [Roseomonas sp. CECT 9278]|uniref:alpha/beta fold hydrolase n=1 Tax=Roseomonas sp. CECT 9278 TaxID=2845823 RepID=UPI001E49FD0F|nr:alpha/beta hydrolase [Roseomonas sp. CECT 9278]CAH0198082.1 Epoxide hydrolase A [Roseomonas sp. CECT 9278]
MAHIMVTAGALDVAVELHGPESGVPVVLLHGFPDDTRTYDGVVGPLAAAGLRVVVPYLRGYGPTRYRDPATPRSGQQAALGADLLALMDALGIRRALLAGYDWGGRAACIVAALWPDRVIGLVSATGYNIQDIARSGEPAAPERELRYWYQWYLHTERGAAGLAADRSAFCRLLWRLWSPTYALGDAEYAMTAASFDNPDFVATVVQSYRHRHRAAPGDPALEGIESQLAMRPPITVPGVVLHGAEDGVDAPANSEGCGRWFSGPFRRLVVPGAGHFLPREAPQPWVEALLSLPR